MMHRIFFATSFSLFSLSSLAQAQAINSTDGIDSQCPVNIPGFVHHGNCNLLCRPAKWTDIIVFYLGNYIAHAATITSRPDQSVMVSLIAVMSALLFPGVGVGKGLRAIFSLAKFADTELQVAARAGALCAVVKISDANHAQLTNDQVQEDPSILASDEDIEMQNREAQHNVQDSANNPRFEGTIDNHNLEVAGTEPVQPDLQELRPKIETIVLLETRVHGLCRLPDGYALMILPGTAVFEEPAIPALPLRQRLWRGATALFRIEPTPRTAISCNYNFIKILVSLAQLLYAISTLYSTRGDQITRYGYAAFGLTVAPYAWMTFINLIGNLVCPQYDAMYVVESKELDQLRARIDAAGDTAREQFMVTGTVGRLAALTKADPKKSDIEDHFLRENSDRGDVSCKTLFVSAVPIAIVGGLSQFTPGQSALYQRVWTMTWLVLGCFIGPVIEAERSFDDWMWGVTFCAWLFYSAPAIGGYIVVSQMIKDWGVCQLL